MIHRGICKTCGEEFVSNRANKIYCNMKCYGADPETIERLRRNNDAKRNSAEVKCDYCGGSMIRKKSATGKHNFCNSEHYRLYMADRFDRWIASPETIALPQNYDEFLTSEELPCLVDGCDWVGANLSAHMNFQHGVRHRDFKKMAGFNLKSGIVRIETSAKMREYALARGNNGLIPGYEYHPTRSNYRSLEAREHQTKAYAIRGADDSLFGEGVCLHCGGTMTISPNGRTRKYCSIECRNAVYAEKNNEKKYPLVCGRCGKGFDGNIFQKRRNDKGLLVYCDTQCRQTANGSKSRGNK